MADGGISDGDSAGYPECDEGFLTGRLVQVVDLAEELRPLASLQGWLDKTRRDEDDPATPISANGLVGQAVAYDAESERYAVFTFDKVLLNVPERNLQEWDAPEPEEEGGFDLVWPNEFNGPEAHDRLAEDMVTVLHSKGYCVVQLWHSQEEREAVTDLAFEVRDWHLPLERYEAAYLGPGNTTKFTVIPPYESEEGLDPAYQAIVPYQSVLSDVALKMEPYASVLGHELKSILNSMLRVPMANPRTEAPLLRPAPPMTETRDEGDGEFSISEDTRERLGQAIFLERRTFMMMVTIDNAGGLLTLNPRADLEDIKIVIPLTRNKLIIFNSLLLGHSYAPSGEWSTALQTWLLKDSSRFVDEDEQDKTLVALPDELISRNVHITSAMVNYPGKATGPQNFWLMAASATDAATKVPTSRFDIDLYYAFSGKDGHSEGQTYTMHGSFVSNSGLLYFDNQKFKISSSEARLMSPGQRLIMETGYEAFYRAGHTVESLDKFDCGVFLGDSGSLWVDEAKEISGFTWGGNNQAVSSCRLSHVLGLQGACLTVDTACSSSLVAVSLAHNSIRAVNSDEAKLATSTPASSAMALGLTLMLTPRWFVLYCGPKMLSPRGRCFTFDGSADGFARGEGCGAAFCTSPDPRDEEAYDDMLAILVGSAANQDGRSASMTAPHGPSQQQCILSSMKESELNPSEMSMAECHGTGTALGDPIEVSALRMVMQKREPPILNTSAKTVVGHLEAAAGLAGLVKCVLSVLFSTASPNAHFQLLNPHLDVNGYPVYFVNEASDYGYKSSLAGVSSFGFGGTNARGDIWGRAQLGARRTSQVIHTLARQSQAVTFQRIVDYGGLGPQGGDMILAVGSWDGWRAGHVLESIGTSGEFSFVLIIGETRREFFSLALNESMDALFRPAYCNSDQHADVIGPDYGASFDKTWWMIDAKADGCPAGTVYRVTFTWRFSWERGEYKSLWWEPYELMPHSKARRMKSFTHGYFIMGTFNSWASQEMEKSKDEEGLWQCDVRIGLRGEEEFQFSRDADWRQVIYPAMPRARKTSIPIRGPDNGGEGKTWLLRGPEGEVVSIQLRILDGEITMTTSSLTKGVKIWQSIEDAGWSQYYVTGSFNSWAFSAMEPDVEDKSFYRCRVQLGPSGDEEFQIAVEKDWQKRLYPSKGQASLGEASCCGPDAFGQDDLTWLISGRPGQEFEICLDMEQTDSNWVVWWAEVEDADAGQAEEEADEAEAGEANADDETGEIFIPHSRGAR